MKFTLKQVSAGFSLLEVLVALVILTIGLLGIGALYITSGKQVQTGLTRGQAAALSREIVERMRVNREAAGNYHFPNGYSDFASKRQDDGVDCYQSACSSADLARYDLYVWTNRVSGMLGGDARISVLDVDETADPPDRFIITVVLRWTENRDERVTEQAFDSVIRK